jgi:proprotein convertase subtilisin/kexin type 2
MKTKYFVQTLLRCSIISIVAVLTGCGSGEGDEDDSVTSSDLKEPLTTVATTVPFSVYQWYLENKGQITDPDSPRLRGEPGVDLNLQYHKNNTTLGKGVTVAIVSKGLDIKHRNLKENIPDLNKLLHYNYSAQARDVTDPSPTYHDAYLGTALAGIIAAFNKGGGAGRINGIAQSAKLIGINVFNDDGSLAENAIIPQGNVPSALLYSVDPLLDFSSAVDISVNAWEPANIGSVDRHGYRQWVDQATKEGVTTGRNGKGVVYLFPAGDERYGPGKNIQYDTPGFGWSNFNASSVPQVMSICAVNAKGVSSQYSNYGSNLWVCGLSDNGDAENNDIKASPGMLTTLPFDHYTHTFGGTAAATATVAGVVAAILGKRPELNWRDIRLILARTARILPAMKDDPKAEWITTQGLNPYSAAHYQYSKKYGFGLVDAQTAIYYAMDHYKRSADDLLTTHPWWPATCIGAGKPVKKKDFKEHVIDISCQDKKEIEAVDFEIELEHPNFRTLSMTLETPQKTRIPLTKHYAYCGAQKKGQDCSTARFNHVFKTSVTAALGENPNGVWKVHLSKGQILSRGKAPTVKNIKLVIY